MKRPAIFTALLTALLLAGCNAKERIEIDESSRNPSYTITITSDGRGSAEATSGESATLKAAEGTKIGLNATPNVGYVFREWTVLSGGVVIQYPATAPPYFIMPAGAVSIRADFAILNMPFSATTGTFSTVSVLGDQIWTLDSANGYVAMSGYASSINNPNEDWLISPAMDLTGKAAVKLSFDHAVNNGTVANMVSNHTLWVSTDYIAGSPSTGTWSQVTIATYPTGSDWTFVSTGDIALPASALNKAGVRIAFKYVCSSAESATWRIRNVLVTD